MIKNTTEVMQGLEVTVKHYLKEIEELEWEQLLQKTDEEEWSIGQMMMHLIQSAQTLHLENVDKCLAADRAGETTGGEKTERGRAAYEQGSFPPIRIQVPPSPQYTPKQPESKKQLQEGLLAVLERMRQAESALDHMTGAYKINHSGFGALNANEWFLLVEMHFRHHIRQLERLKRELNL